MGFSDHQIHLDIPQSGTLINDLRAIGDGGTAGYFTSAVLAVAPLGPSGAVFEMFVEILVNWIAAAFRCPNPLVDGLVEKPHRCPSRPNGR